MQLNKNYRQSIHNNTLVMPTIYHITTSKAWEEAKAKGVYETTSLKEEGYIHCSLENQINGVLERYFAGQKGLVRLEIDTEKLEKPFIYDWSVTNEDTFPHVYGPINLEAVLKVTPLN
jgi:uncharacterized protein (DUF952 family)